MLEYPTENFVMRCGYSDHVQYIFQCGRLILQALWLCQSMALLVCLAIRLNQANGLC